MVDRLNLLGEVDDLELSRQVSQCMPKIAPLFDDLCMISASSPEMSWGQLREEHPSLFIPLNDQLQSLVYSIDTESTDMSQLFEVMVVEYMRYSLQSSVDERRFPKFLDFFLKHMGKDAAILSTLIEMGASSERIVATMSRHVKASVLFAMEEEQASSFDGLTELLKPEVFAAIRRRELERLLRNQQGMALAQFFVDLDKFKTVNDVHGHKEGNRVLIEVGRIFKKQLRTIDVVSRLGGDEFGVLAVVNSVEECRELAERLRSSVEEADLGVTLSIGISISKPNGMREKLKDGVSVSKWLDVEEVRLASESDQAASVAKYEFDRNAVCLFSELSEVEKISAKRKSALAAKKREEA